MFHFTLFRSVLSRFAIAPMIIFVAVIVSAPGVAAPAQCEAGIYAHGEDVAAVYDRLQADGSLRMRYVFVDGRRGMLDEENAALRCEAGRVRSQTGQDYSVTPIIRTDTRFTSGDLTLAGRLIEPATPYSGARPLVVFVHGSERTPMIGNSYYPLLLAAQGISVFVYDKRGTGQSEGSYTQNFELLANDTVAAAVEARRIANGRFSRFGLFGGSQGGWVAPLAANRSGAEFVVVGFGLVLAPREEDAEQVYDELRRAGYGPSVLADARQVTQATGDIISSRFTVGFEALADAKVRFADEAWFQAIEGEFTGAVIRASEQDLRQGIVGDREDNGVLWNHDPIPVLQGIEVPQLWVIATNDTEAPGMLTQERLRSLQDDGQPITTALFPNTDHGMVEFETQPDGSRQYTQFTDGYFRLIADFMHGVHLPPYGAAQIQPPVHTRPLRRENPIH